MIRWLAARLARMDAAELSWRGMAAARTLADRARARIVAPRWRREDLRTALAGDGDLAAAKEALASGRWDEAHRELARHYAAAPRRFVVAASDRDALRSRILAEYPDAAAHAAARADRILSGEYDLLGYRGLSFDPPARPARPAPPARRDASAPDWHLDPVHERRAPTVFWSDVPYLAPECGDHKIIWELNRHQHWIALGRAYWLTGETTYRDRFVAELTSWLDANPPLTGINWASMLELGFRSLSWLWAIQLFVDRDQSDGSLWLVDLLVALDRQLTHIEHNLSYYFSPNTHLLGEALALYVCGRTLPQLAAGARREATGRDILVAEIGRQIASDGGHAERSTHYHRYTLDFYCLALVVARNTDDDAAAQQFEEAVVRLGAAARLLADDQGRVPRIGDDDGGALLPLTGGPTDDLRGSLAIAAALVGRPDFQIGRPPEEAVWMTGGASSESRIAADSRIPTESRTLTESRIPNPESHLRSSALPDTGYYVSRSAAEHLVIDGGPHGYQNAGHAHADALSLTLSVRGLPLLIDPGTGCYTIDRALRDRLRSTALHNTLTLDDRAQSVPSGPFHWSHVANSRVHAWRTNDRFDYFDGSHDGYRPIEHRRRVFSLHGDLVVVADLVTEVNAHTAVIGEGRTHAAAVHWHLDPGWTIQARSRGATLTGRGADGAEIRVGLTVPQGLLEPFTGDQESGLGWYSPEYGRIEPATTVRVSQSGDAPFWMVTVFDLDPQNAVADVDWMPVWSEAGTTAHAAAIRITRATSVDHVLIAAPHEEAEPNVFAAVSAGSAVERGQGPWRVGEIETDARLLFCRTAADGRVHAVAMVDGSRVRAAGRRGLDLALSRVMPDFFWTKDHGRATDQDSKTKDQTSCVASPVS
jgi:hypothetical protein